MSAAAGLPDPRSLLDLTGKSAVITGAAEGIGAEIARHFAGAGARLVLLDRKVDLLEAAAASLVAAGAEAIGIPTDIGDERQVIDAVVRTVAHFGGVDILVNNAGIHDRALLLDTSAETWDRIQAINGRGAFLCLREAARAMVDAGRGGRIINISSIGSINPILPGLTAYAASKAGVNAVTRNAAMELASHGILVNAIMPGGVATPGAAGASGPPVTGRVLEPPLLGHIAQPSDIAAMALFLAGSGAGAITGQCFAVEAGYLLG
jgi:NAD(P)-dependent dehydrogenase (short-subunit alcohol dehydrogenase family)